MKEAMSIELFLDPIEEVVDGELFSGWTDHIVACVNWLEVEAEESGTEAEPKPRAGFTQGGISITWRASALWGAGRRVSDPKMPLQFLKYNKLIKSREAADCVNQTSLDDWMSGGLHKPLI